MPCCHRILLAAAVAVALAPVVACSDEGGSATTEVVQEHLAATEEYLPDVAADVYLPDAGGRVPLVVMVPGGGWTTADRSGLTPLAETLAAGGMAVVNATYRAAQDGVHFPTPVQDVICAIRYGVARVTTDALQPGPIVVLGHSAGAHLAALAVLAEQHFEGECKDPPVSADALVGLAGPYDVAAFADTALALFDAAPTEAPDLWTNGSPLTWVGERPAVPVFLGHGDQDELVPLSSSSSFADLLEQAGHTVQLEVVIGADHADVFDPAFIAEPLSVWISSLS